MSGPLKFSIDWDADSDYSDAGEDVSDRVDGDLGVVWSRGKDQIRQFAPGQAGTAAFALYNASRDYSPGNMSSPIYGSVLPGRKVQIESNGSAGDDFLFVDGSDFLFVDGSDFTFLGTPGRVIWVGQTDEINQNPPSAEGAQENPTVTLNCIGNLGRLRGKTISTALYHNIFTSDFLNHVLDEAGWPADQRSIQTGLTIMEWPWLDKQDAFEAVMSIVATEGPGASVYEDPNGFLVFENRDSRTTQTRSTVSQATFTDTGELSSLRYDPNFKDAIEAATLQVDERQMQGQTVIWQLNETLVLSPFEIRRFQVRSSSGDPFTNVVFPSAAPNDTVQTLTPETTLTAGQGYAKFRDEVAATPTDWNDTASDIQATLESISTIGAGNVVCNGGPWSSGTPVTVSFVGDFAGQNITDLIEFVNTSFNPVSAEAVIEVTEEHAGDGILSEKQALRPSTPLTSGAFQIDMPEEHPFTTGVLNYNDSAATVQAAIRVSGSWGSVTCSGGPMSSGIPIQVNLIYSANLSPMSIVGSTVMGSVPTATINVVVTTQGGKPDYVCTAGVVGFELDRDSGAVVTLAVGADVGGCTVKDLQIRANPVTVVRSHQVSFPEDVTDIPVGRIFKPNNVRPEISLDFAREYVQMLVDHYSVPRPTVTFTTITSIYDPANDALYEREISDLITIMEGQTGISDTYHIEQIRQSLVGLALVTEFGCEKSIDSFATSLRWY